MNCDAVYKAFKRHDPARLAVLTDTLQAVLDTDSGTETKLDAFAAVLAASKAGDAAHWQQFNWGEAL